MRPRADDLIAIRAKVFAELLAGAFARQGLLHPAPLSRLQVVGMPLHVPNDVFSLHLALKPAQRILQRLTFLQAHFSQMSSPVKPSIAKAYIMGITTSYIPAFVGNRRHKNLLVPPKKARELSVSLRCRGANYGWTARAVNHRRLGDRA